MGYTHYWELPAIDIDTWREIQSGVKAVVAETSAKLNYEFNDPDPPLVDSDVIRFNGHGSAGHETFFVERGGLGGFNFCKTARKPYDEAVTAVLCIVGHHLTKAGELNKPYYINSDGYWDDWLPGRTLAADVLDEPLQFALGGGE